MPSRHQLGHASGNKFPRFDYYPPPEWDGLDLSQDGLLPWQIEFTPDSMKSGVELEYSHPCFRRQSDPEHFNSPQGERKGC